MSKLQSEKKKRRGLAAPPFSLPVGSFKTLVLYWTQNKILMRSFQLTRNVREQVQGIMAGMGCQGNLRFTIDDLRFFLVGG